MYLVTLDAHDYIYIAPINHVLEVSIKYVLKRQNAKSRVIGPLWARDLLYFEGFSFVGKGACPKSNAIYFPGQYECYCTCLLQ